MTHLKPVPVVHLLSNIRCVSAQGQLYGSGHCKPPSLHSKWHEAGAEHCSPHVHIQVWYMDVWLPGDDNEINELQIKLGGLFWNIQVPLYFNCPLHLSILILYVCVYIIVHCREMARTQAAYFCRNDKLLLQNNYLILLLILSQNSCTSEWRPVFCVLLQWEKYNTYQSNKLRNPNFSKKTKQKKDLLKLYLKDQINVFSLFIWPPDPKQDPNILKQLTRRNTIHIYEAVSSNMCKKI